MTPKTHKQKFATHSVPGQSSKFVYVYVFYYFPDKVAASQLDAKSGARGITRQPSNFEVHCWLANTTSRNANDS